MSPEEVYLVPTLSAKKITIEKIDPRERWRPHGGSKLTGLRRGTYLVLTVFDRVIGGLEERTINLSNTKWKYIDLGRYNFFDIGC